MTEKPASTDAPRRHDDDMTAIAQILADTFDADNHETLDADITRLMMDLSAELDLDFLTRRADGEERFRTLVKAVLMALGRRAPQQGR